MGSYIGKLSDEKIRGFAGKKYDIPMYMQFVPGFAVDVVTSEESTSYKGDYSLNTIIAIPHLSKKLLKKKNLAIGNEEHRYYPLLRGMTDVPTKGDPVLLCTIGQIQYYLGPLNTENNPTWNPDPSYKAELMFIPSIDSEGKRANSINFNKEKNYKRLVKFRKDELDYGNVINETSGDMIFEGRHGNSLRIGSRNNNPYMFISNNRPQTNSLESLGDGSIVSITSNGTLAQHFGDTKNENNEISFGFTLSSDTLQEPNRFMGTLISNVNNNQSPQELIYDYNKDQTLLHSERITINSKLDDIYLSSIKDIHIGTGRHLTISTNENLIISAQRTFIGNPTDRSDSMESMVLGTTLLELLKETLAVIKNSQGLCQGIPIPLVDETKAPGSVNLKIAQIEQKIDQILSTKHFIEPNT
tara:strand:- start:258 stop:1499 length:1242 start_codon:yes stop_codon:yes gene_type:complete